MTRSASRAASRGGSPQAAGDNVKIVVAAAAAAAAHYQPLDAQYPDRVRAPSVSRCGYSESSPDFSSSRLGRASAKGDKSVEHTTAVATLGTASGSAAGRQVLNQLGVLEVVSRGGEVLREMVQAVVMPHRRVGADSRQMGFAICKLPCLKYVIIRNNGNNT